MKPSWCSNIECGFLILLNNDVINPYNKAELVVSAVKCTQGEVSNSETLI